MRIIFLNDIGAPLEVANQITLKDIPREQTLTLNSEEVARKLFERVRDTLVVTDPAKVRVFLLTRNPEFGKHALIVAPAPNWRRLNLDEAKAKEPEHYLEVARKEAERLQAGEIAILVDEVASTMFGQKRLTECGGEFERRGAKVVLAAGILVFPASDFDPEPVRRKILCGFEANACIRLSDLVNSKPLEYPHLVPYASGKK
ncbi:hypothetical protein HYS54_02850 [Candidatus Micrarchaeota archaeon]|nr:hypothetical protein [Candidatus Micrarchaeota archaeon]